MDGGAPAPGPAVAYRADRVPADYYDPMPFGADTSFARKSDTVAIGRWWEASSTAPARGKQGREIAEMSAFIRERPRDQVLAFALYTHDHGVLNLTAQSFPLLPDEPKVATLEIQREGRWVAVGRAPVEYPGWTIRFRVEHWDNTQDVPYRVRLGDLSRFEGTVRRDPIDQDTLVVANLSCNSPRDKERFTRLKIVENLKRHDPDLLFFAGDQNYTHAEGTFGWLQFGLQYADLMKDRPTVCIPDDHDVGHGNLWGAGGRQSDGEDGMTDGGYAFPASFVNMIQRQQTSNLPAPFDPTPVQQGIGVYYTDLTVGGVSFAILEDRKFKSGPKGSIPKMGPRHDHINDPAYDRGAIDLPGLTLLGDRQLAFLDHWARDWRGTRMKVALSQTAFCGAVHLHRDHGNRLLADLDCNGWPQAGRNRALVKLRAARATHLCGDQHLGAVVKHGIDGHRDGPMAFTSPALVNTVYGRWWWPEDERPGGGDAIDSVLPWTGDFEDGLGNKITMFAYANPEQTSPQELRADPARENRGDGYGLVRLTAATGDVVFEAWPRFADLDRGDAGQYPGWPVGFNHKVNDGRTATAHLEAVTLPGPHAVVELTETATGRLVYCRRVAGRRVAGRRFAAPVFGPGTYTLRVGADRPQTTVLDAVRVE